MGVHCQSILLAHQFLLQFLVLLSEEATEIIDFETYRNKNMQEDSN